MARTFVNFGDGRDGFKDSSGGVNGPLGNVSGTIGSLSLNTTLNTTAGEMIMIHQSQHTNSANYGKFEINFAAGTNSGGSIPLVLPLERTYTSSGDNRAQVVRMQQLTGVNLSGSQTIDTDLWNGSYGGILGLIVSGALNLNCDNYAGIDGAGKGFRGNSTRPTNGAISGRRGEGQIAGTYGDITTSNSGAAGGGGSNLDGGGGGGAGGVSGTQGGGGGIGGQGGSPYYVASTLNEIGGIGGGGGEGARKTGSVAGTGGKGGAFIYIAARQINITGSNININANGENGINASAAGGDGAGGGGGGGGGGIFIVTQSLNINNNTIETKGGSAGSGAGGSSNGGAGGAGAILINGCQISGTTNNPSYSSQEGGFSFCGAGSSIIG